jgi:hypothetical protein
MLSFLSKADELDWTQDPAVIETRRNAAAAKAELDRTEAARAAAWREDSIQGCNPPPDSRFWDIKRAANMAAQNYVDAAVVRDHAEAIAKEAVRPALCKQYRAHVVRVADAMAILRDELRQAESLRLRAEAVGLTGGPWMPAALYLEYLAVWTQAIEQAT